MVNIGCIDNGAFMTLVRAGFAQYAVGEPLPLSLHTQHSKSAYHTH